MVPFLLFVSPFYYIIIFFFSIIIIVDSLLLFVACIGRRGGELNWIDIRVIWSCRFD